MYVCCKVFEENVCTVTGVWITRHGDKLTVIIIIIIGGGVVVKVAVAVVIVM
jgi:uncharacterized Rmd1/YagE family protein